MFEVSDTLSMAKYMLPPLASFGRWLSAEGLTVDRSTLTDPDLIERYVQTGMADRAETTRATERSTLRRVARRLDPAPLPSPEPIERFRARPPYRRWEVARFLELARAQPTSARRRSTLAILALGLGCGLDRPDLAWVRGCDVTVARHTATRVVGGPRPRTIVALDDYAEILAQCATAAGETLLIGGTTLGRHNVATPVLDRMFTDASLPRVVPARLRSTWLVRHLDLMTPLQVLLPAAGLQSSRTLDDLLPYADPIEDRLALQLLRGVAG